MAEDIKAPQSAPTPCDPMSVMSCNINTGFYTYLLLIVFRYTKREVALWATYNPCRNGSRAAVTHSLQGVPTSKPPATS